MTEHQEDPFIAAADSTANDTYASDVTTAMTTSSAFPYQDDHVHVEAPSMSQALVGAAKRKRGRPKKYNSPEELRAARKAYYKNNAKMEKTTENSNNNVDENGKKKRGRPKKSDEEAEVAVVRAALAKNNTVIIMQNGQERFFANGVAPLTDVSMFHHMGHRVAGDFGDNYRAGVIHVADGEDIVQKLAFPQVAGSVLNVLSAVGFVKAASLRTAEDLSGQSVEYQGHFEIMSLSGAYAWTEYRGKVGALSTILRSPEGQFLGGGISRYLLAAGPVQVKVSTCLRKSPRKAIAASGTRGAAYVSNGRTPALMHCDVYRPVMETSQGYMFRGTDTHQNNGTASAPHMVSQAVAHQHSDGDYITSQADTQQNSVSTNTVGTYMAFQSDNHQNVATSEGTNDRVPEAGEVVDPLMASQGQAEDGAPQSSLPMETTIS
ncbi:hypothetical protein Droror1_Dr00024749 [Drosera rotundifolia]